MVTLFRWLLRLTVGLIAGAVLLVGVAAWFALRSLPDYGATYSVAGIAAPVEIVRSSDAVPHLFATSDADAFFALGFVHAQDRLLQMTLLRRAAQGRLSEVLGGRAFAADDLARRMGFARTAAASVAAQDAPTRAALDAYAAGVNQWIETVNRDARGRGAPEFFFIPDEIAYWRAADSLAVLKLIAASSTTALADEVLRARLSLALPSRGTDIVAAPGDPAIPAYQQVFASGRFSAPVEPDATAPEGPGLPGPGAGASASGFAVEAARTAAGQALLANDPAGSLSVPGLWYLARLQLSSGDVIGATIPGIPAVLSGRSANLAWGVTPAHVDDQDLAVEEVEPGAADRYRATTGWRDFVTTSELVRIRGAAPQTITLRSTVNGPVIPAGHFGLRDILPAGHVAALRWTGLSEADTSLTALMGLMRATDRAGAAAALTALVVPALEVTLADKDGVSLVSAGARPARDASHATAGLMPAPGWVAGNGWPAMLPTAGPRAADKGIVATTGRAADPADATRMLRLQRLLDSREVHTRDSLIATQLDSVSPAARALLPLVGAELWFTGEPAPKGTPERQRQDALTLLAEWDGDMSEHLPEPLVYAAWMASLQHRLIRDELGPTAAAVTALRPAFIEAVFRNRGGAAIWCDVIQSAPQEDCATIARQALDAALLDLTNRLGADVATWRWGNLHEARQKNPILGQAPGLGFIVNLRHSLSGGDFTLALGGLQATGPTPFAVATAAGYRGVYDLADPDSSVFVTATGQSGHPLSRHYDDLAERWRRGEYVAMSLDPELARAGADGVTRLLPRE